ncbi:hypothetical protein GZL_02512 [Streptomyces sp. 769]|nr:hypothetical protein GZL_02512 [Streptomyces sp. 769]
MEGTFMDTGDTRFAYCFDHGDLHVFQHEVSWCTAVWVSLAGTSSAEAMADKQASFGAARFLDQLPLEQQAELLAERTVEQRLQPGAKHAP